MNTLRNDEKGKDSAFSAPSCGKSSAAKMIHDNRRRAKENRLFENILMCSKKNSSFVYEYKVNEWNELVVMEWK